MTVTDEPRILLTDPFELPAISVSMEGFCDLHFAWFAALETLGSQAQDPASCSTEAAECLADLIRGADLPPSCREPVVRRL